MSSNSTTGLETRTKKRDLRTGSLTGLGNKEYSNHHGKKRRVHQTAQCQLIRFQKHPLGVQPWGNYLLSKTRFSRRNAGLGKFSTLSDELITQVLSYFPAEDLAKLLQTSKPFYCFCSNDELWRPLVFQKFLGDFKFRCNWRETYRSSLSAFEVEPSVNITVTDFYSDALFSMWKCSTASVEELFGSSNDLMRDNIERRSNLDLKEFISEYAEKNKPVILTDVVTKWEAFKSWSEETLIERFGDVKFRAEAVDITLRDYFTYAKQTHEEAPMYLFDKFFPTRTSLAREYVVPEYFSEDLFSLLGPNRPDYRWIIIGPKRSGSSFHVDPNSTSAWNAVIRGAKKWILYPPGTTPPGVFPSADGSEVTAPVSLAEWCLNYYHQTKMQPIKPIEAVCREGEIIFVPNGWWHLVLNIEDSIAITQNFVCEQNLRNVISFLKFKPEQVSGWGVEAQTDFHADGTIGVEKLEEYCESGKQLFNSFVEALKIEKPELLDRVTDILETNEPRQLKKNSFNSDSFWNEKNQMYSDVTSNFSFKFNIGSGIGDVSS